MDSDANIIPGPAIPECKEWFVMRDLTRSNAKSPAYKRVEDMGIKVFTPMVWKLYEKQGKRCRKQIPYMHDLLFIFETREKVDYIVEQIPTLQYRYVRGAFCKPMTIRNIDMERFIHAVELAGNPRFYTPAEITAEMIGRKVKIIGGPLDGYEGFLQKVRGTKSKYLLVELPSFLSVSVKIQPEFIQLL